MSWFRKFSFEDPEQSEIPEEYEDIGHSSRTESAVPWLFVDGKLLLGTRSHAEIVEQLARERGPEAAYETLMSNWRGRYDPDNHEMSMVVENADRAGQSVEPPPALIMLLQKVFPGVERIWSFPGSRPVLGHFDDAALDRLYKTAWRYHFAKNYFEQGKQYTNADFWINTDEQSKDIVFEGNSRQRQVHYKQANAENDPLWLATFIGKNWRWTIPTATAFLAWFASVGGDSNQLVQDVQRGAMPTEVLRQVQPENLDDQVSEIGSEPAIQEISQNRENQLDVSPEMEYDAHIDTSNLDGLDPTFVDKVKQILSTLSQKGWQPRVASGLRSIEEQQEKIDQGKSSLKNPQNSKHVQGLAVDVIDKRYGWGGPAADLDFEFWNDLGEVAREVGLTWGGDWKDFRDVAHVESTGHQKGGMVYIAECWTHKYA